MNTAPGSSTVNFMNRRNVVKRFCYGIFWICVGLMVSAGSVVLAQEPPASVAGNWTLYCKDPNGSPSTKYLSLRQNGTLITGHFQGPNQSGGVEGTIEAQHLVVRTKTRVVLTFRGRVDGPRLEGVVQGSTYDGTFHDRAGTGSFRAIRAN